MKDSTKFTENEARAIYNFMQGLGDFQPWMLKRGLVNVGTVRCEHCGREVEANTFSIESHEIASSYKCGGTREKPGCGTVTGNPYQLTERGQALYDDFAYHHRGWGDDQVKTFVKEVRKASGEAWNKFLGPEMREALIAREAMRTVLSMQKRDINVEDIRSLYSRMLIEAGLRKEDE
jgi:hypothetical protein